MALDYATAAGEIKEAFWDAWRDGAPAHNGGEVPRVEWEGLGTRTAPRQDEVWARLTVDHSLGAQRSIGGLGARRFERAGVVTAQIFAPADAGGVTTVRQLGKIVAAAFEGQETPGGVWFRDVAFVDVGPREGWIQANVVAEFVYDEVK